MLVERLRRSVNLASGLCALALAIPAPLTVAVVAPQTPALGGVIAASLLVAIAAGCAMRWGANRLLARAAGSAHDDERLRFHTTLENISQGVCFFDGQQRLIVSNGRYAQMYGLDPVQTAPGTLLREIVDHRYARGSFPAMTREAYLAWRRNISVSSTPSDTETVLADGRIIAIHHRPMPDGGWVATHEDITERRRAQAHIEHLARSDALTGLANRIEFRERLEGSLGAAAACEGVAVLFVDLDNFKNVNDTLGHPAGDRLLCAVAARLAACIRQADLLARLGGDEFAIVQAGAQPASSRALAERVVREMGRAFDIDGHRVQIGASVGVAFADDAERGPDTLVGNADRALYAAKAAGRGVHRVFQGGMGLEPATKLAPA